MFDFAKQLICDLIADDMSAYDHVSERMRRYRPAMHLQGNSTQNGAPTGVPWPDRYPWPTPVARKPWATARTTGPSRHARYLARCETG